MRGFLKHFWISLRLNFRNVQALVFGYFVPLFFLVAFRGLYATKPYLMREFGQLLVISTLGGACFGLPVTLVSERDRGVWRRYRLAPLHTLWFVASLMLSRFVMIASSALLLLCVAMIFFGMPMPAQPLQLLAAYCVMSFSFLSVGLVIAMLANSPGAVQAIGQCIFLPMIILGGVGVKVEMLGGWQRHAASFLPSHYAVRVLNECIVTKGTGLNTPQSLFDLIALTAIGLSCCLIGVKLFRWENDQKSAWSAKAWALIALAVWAAVGLIAREYKFN